jgi:hypothetical protein
MSLGFFSAHNCTLGNCFPPPQPLNPKPTAIVWLAENCQWKVWMAHMNAIFDVSWMRVNEFLVWKTSPLSAPITTSLLTWSLIFPKF